MKQVVLALGHQGDVIIVGHGARFILPSQFGLCVRMVAPIEARIRRVADKANLSLTAARVEVEKTDRERVKMVHRHFGQDVTDPAMGRIVKCVRKSCLHIKSFFLFFVFLLVSIFVFLPPGFGSSPLLERRCNRPGLTCYPYNDFAYTISFPIPGERAETIL